MFTEEGELRRDDDNNPLVKFQVNYREAESSAEKVFDPDKVEDLLFANAFKLIDVNMNPTPESIEVNPTVQGPVQRKNTGNVVQDAIDAITQPDFIDTHEGEHFEVGPNETEVTTFIHGVEEGSDFDSLANQMAVNLGTSIDKLYRVWRKAKTSDSVIEYMKANQIGSWVGLSRMYIPIMCQEFERIEKFFASKEETPIPVDLIFKGTINVNGKTHDFIGKPDIITVDKNGKYPDLYAAFDGIDMLSDADALEGEETLMSDLNSESELNFNAGGNTKVQEIIEHGFNQDKTFDEIMADWNAAWSDAQAALGVEIR